MRLTRRDWSLLNNDVLDAAKNNLRNEIFLASPRRAGVETYGGIIRHGSGDVKGGIA
jgi:hypothetical protein